MTTRAEFLARIRGEMAKVAGLSPARPAPRPARPAEAAARLRASLARRRDEILERFRAEFVRVGGDFHRVARVADVPRVVAAIARERDVRSAVAWHARAIGADLAAALAAEGLAVDAATDGADASGRARMRASAAVAGLGVTGVDLAIADTGTLVLRSGAGRPRATSLLPPYHVAVLDAAALVESLEQVGVVLEAWHGGGDAADPGAMISFVTGPSRSADIELTLTRGVHGPKEVHALFVDGGLGG